MILETRNLKKHFNLGKNRVLHAVDGVDLTIGENEIVGLVGESGCGKSTFARTIAGLYSKTGGEVRYKGSKMPMTFGTKDFLRYSREIQMIFQDPYSALNPRMTVRDIIAEGPLLHGMWKNGQANQRAGEWLERVGLSRDHLSRYPHEFSGGQRQRVGIARALAMQPKFLICDEPISALDVSVQAQVVNLLADLQREFGLSLLFVAHDLSMVRYVSHRMAVMYLGQIVEIGPADEIFYRPAHPYTRLLIDSNPTADPKAERARNRELMNGEIPTPINVGLGCRFAGRCPRASSDCQGPNPQLRQVRPGHFVACPYV